MWFFIITIVLLFSSVRVSNPEKEIDRTDSYNLHEECVQGIHRQIDKEMHSSLVYSAMAAYFDNNNVARPGAASYFLRSSQEEHEQALKFIGYLNRRGAKFTNFKIKMPSIYSWNGTISALRDAILLEKLVNNKMHLLHKSASNRCRDQHLMDFIEDGFLDQQVDSIDKLQRFITILDGMDTKMGEYLFDQQLIKEQE